MTKPFIAVTCSSTFGLAWGEYSTPSRLDYVVNEYTRALEASGGVPVGVPVVGSEETVAAILDHADGLLLTGGPDITPSVYGRETEPGLGQLDHQLDLMELAAARLALDRGLPVFGICRGIQMLAAAGGGSLYQDLPSQVEGALQHAPGVDKAVLTHQVNIEPSSRLEGIIGPGPIWVNGKHHQAVRELPQGFVVSATASDGVIEAIERPDGPFALGVQWHPEGTFAGDEPSRRLFQAFVEACRAG